ncbi:GMC oxidoreductase [Nocardioides dubius]|uniref:Cholesterol oxidase n=1 Tax=Nocardioides dubius TaxID=317019 RepID=A0ABN1TK43_9ACTN
MRSSRRSFLVGAAAAAAVASLPEPAVAATAEEHRVLVIGSGFGGGVAALRLAQAGVPVTVLERGRWWRSGPDASTFPSPLSPDKRLLWYGATPKALRATQDLIGGLLNFGPYVGLVEPILGENMLSMVAAGVGGGSLVYQGMTLQPSRETFHEVLPEQLDFDLMDRVHYPRVAQMLGVETAPDELVSSVNYKAPRVFKKRAEAAGYSVEKIPMPIDWDYALAELRGEMKPAYTDGSGAMGVNNGGKHSVDVTYIDQAVATGRVTVRTHHNVNRIERARDGRWVVHVDRTDDTGRVLEQIEMTTPTLIMAAGSMNTTKLLVEAKGSGAVPGLPDGLGTGWGTNGDRIFAWTNLVDQFGAAQGGPVVYGSKDWADPALANTVIQASIPPVPLLVNNLTMMVGFGVSQGRGEFRYDSWTKSAKLHWPASGDVPVHDAITARVERIAKNTGGIIDTHKIVPSTWHPLGGANMGVVCDLDGRVEENPGLYVLDGALIPGSTAACNPSMTIAAVAERALDNIVRHDVGVRI